MNINPRNCAVFLFGFIKEEAESSIVDQWIGNIINEIICNGLTIDMVWPALKGESNFYKVISPIIYAACIAKIHDIYGDKIASEISDSCMRIFEGEYSKSVRDAYVLIGKNYNKTRVANRLNLWDAAFVELLFSVGFSENNNLCIFMNKEFTSRHSYYFNYVIKCMVGRLMPPIRLHNGQAVDVLVNGNNLMWIENQVIGKDLSLGQVVDKIERSTGLIYMSEIIERGEKVRFIMDRLAFEEFIDECFKKKAGVSRDEFYRLNS